MDPCSAVNAKVLDIMRELQFVDLHETLNTVVKKFYMDKAFYMAVMDEDGNIFGVITELIIRGSQRKDVNFQSTCAWEICSPSYEVIAPATPLSEAIDIMHRNRVRYLVVTGEEGVEGIVTPLEILSIRDRAAGSG